jgi:hypothetical protein
MRGASLIILAVGTLVGCRALASFIDIIPPVDLTRSHITETFCRIEMYVKTNKSIPPSLDVLPNRDGYANSTLDGWNRLLQYRVTEDGLITLTSFGADGKPGGDGENADISETRRVRLRDQSRSQ